MQDHYANALRVRVCTVACLWDEFTFVKNAVLCFVFLFLCLIFFPLFEQDNTSYLNVAWEQVCRVNYLRFLTTTWLMFRIIHQYLPPLSCFSLSETTSPFATHRELELKLSQLIFRAEDRVSFFVVVLWLYIIITDNRKQTIGFVPCTWWVAPLKVSKVAHCWGRINSNGGISLNTPLLTKCALSVNEVDNFTETITVMLCAAVSVSAVNGLRHSW